MPIINKGIFELTDVVYDRKVGNDWPTAQVITTSTILEGDSLYYTNDRVAAFLIEGGYVDQANILANVVAGMDLSSNTTTDLAEGDNLYYTNDRVQSYLTQAGGAGVTYANVSYTGDYYDVFIDNSKTYAITDSMETAVETANTEGNVYLLKSFVVTNISEGTAYLNSNIHYDDGNIQVYANSFMIPYGYSIDLITKPEIMFPNTIIKVQALDSTKTAANNILSMYAIYKSINASDGFYYSQYKTIPESNTFTTAYTSSSTASIVENIKLVNRLPYTLRASIIWTDNDDNLKSHVASNTLLAANYYTEILINTLRLAAGDKLKIAYYNEFENDAVSSFIFAKKNL